MTRTRLSILTIAALGAACSGHGDPAAVDGHVATSPPDATDKQDGDASLPPDARMPDGMPMIDAAPAPDAGYPFMDLDQGCAPIFAQDILPEYDLTIAPSDWDALQYDFTHPQINPDGTIVTPPYHPAQLHIVEGANQYDPPGIEVRIAGNTSWLQAIAYDANPKMQIVISFNAVDPSARFEHLRKVKLDMPRNDWTFLQQRVASAWMRGRAGVPATCANNARLVINGQYYGLYTNLEHQDKSFLKRVYGVSDDGGDLWKSGRIIQTNDTTYSWARIQAFWNLSDLSGIESLVDLDTSMREWSAEAIMGDSDGYNDGRPNYYLYDRPSTGKFEWIENDLDTVLDPHFMHPDVTPVFSIIPSYMPRWEPDWKHYLIVMNDPNGVSRYVQVMSDEIARIDPTEVQSWIDAWSVQIQDAANADPMKPFGNGDHETAVALMRDYVPARVNYLTRWVACWSGGGADGDGDGYDMCHDCDDSNASISPGAPEVCDLVDNNCDGRVDDMADGSTCPANPATPQMALWQKVLVGAKVSSTLAPE